VGIDFGRRPGIGSGLGGRDDLHARVEKLAGDIKRLESASAEEWWDLSKARVDDYIDISGTWTGSNGTISAYIYLDDLDDYRPIFGHVDNPNLGNSMVLNIDPAFSPDPGWFWYAFDERACTEGLFR